MAGRVLVLLSALVLSASAYSSTLRQSNSRSLLQRTPITASVGAFATPIRSFAAGRGSRALVGQSRRALGGASSLKMGLFGLGGPEIAVIVAVAGLVLGPQKLAELARDFGKVAGELKDVPKEFQEGLAQGEDVSKSLQTPKALKEAPEEATPKAPEAVKETPTSTE
eukprot:CAMPEP_0171627424 /NCGR_PEP_ID=MMETSP0990-20121206/20748_1 /TAXON_ID=483369 /ORGANISM="non described non described, Strain CCMP2098" /LENGTH=166 /DNA_ID=CAMNT_0012195245 /DNA_START=12 /DNA_END=512 /DNA_ORIENTATION=+